MNNDKLLRGVALLLALAMLPLATLAQDGWDGDSVAKLQADMASGATSSRKLVEQYLARIDAIDKHGPAINAVIELNPDALKIADELDAERASKGPRGPLRARSASSSSAIFSASGFTSMTELIDGPCASMAAMRAR